MKLHRLAPEGLCLVTEALARGEIERHDPEAYERFLDESAEPVHLDDLDSALDAVIAATPRHDPVSEQRGAPMVRRALPLSRREAAHPGVWRFLAVVHRPDFVRHRWAFEGWATTRGRYWAQGFRHDSNVFSRLWWIAELTRDGDDYSLTERVFARQTLAIQIFVRRYSWDRATVAALLDELDTAAPRVVEHVTRDLLGALGTLVLETMTAAEIRSLVRDIRARVERG